MKKWFSLQPLLLVGLFCWLYSCRSGGEKESPEKILSSPPYAGLTDSIKRFPQNQDLYLERAILLSQNNRHELAAGDYKQAWELKPEEHIALQYVSNLMLVNHPKEAIDLLKECIVKWPANPDLHRRLSEIYAQIGETQKAIGQYDEWAQQDSTNFEVWYEKGALLTQLKDTPAAITALEHAYRIAPINYNGLALASLYGATLNPKVITICDELLRKDTSDITDDVLYLKGSYYSDTKQYDKALQMFNQCISRDWKFTDAYIEKGIVLHDLKKYDSALSVFTMAATVTNTSADAWYWMGRCYEAMGKKDKALENYERAVALDKNFEEAHEGIRRLKK
ncbi:MULTISPECIES: tetratricopeptide repeat protein [Niastella]|uniref:Tetratricopeptide repeat protein n=1 Tax=Niastella soli TaxID=2821487 RepID=A0ABS3Z4J5_9BACT|nr:tetratricopeptide repeat protein [Niastella soli]MBO9205095.1 tetratricopeptide repeat protein [Niastella soli]